MTTTTHVPGLLEYEVAYYSSISSVDGYSAAHRCARGAFANVLGGPGAVSAQNCDINNQPPGVFGVCLCNTYSNSLSTAITKSISIECTTNYAEEGSTAVSLLSAWCTSAEKAAATEPGGGTTATLCRSRQDRI